MMLWQGLMPSRLPASQEEEQNRLHCELTAPDCNYSILAYAIRASSTGDNYSGAGLEYQDMNVCWDLDVDSNSGAAIDLARLLW
jgi:hypothetical protein